MEITSTKNSQIKYVKQLQAKSKLRIEEKCLVIEGVREIGMAIKNHYRILKAFISKEHYCNQLQFSDDTEIVYISSNVYEHIAYRSSTEGVIAICIAKPHQLNDLKMGSHKPLVLVLESPEKPGNIGAILRTADAAGVDAVIIANPRTDLYNPNSIRSSLGAIFSNQIAVALSGESIDYLVESGFNIYAATLQNSNSYLKHDYRLPTAFVIGSEAHGLSQIWRTHPKIKPVNIPMQGEIDSMNLSVSTAILTFEAVRQRS